MGTSSRVSRDDRVRETLDRVVALFESGDVPVAIAKATHPPADVPSGRWSLSNRVIAMLHGTSDARGFRQWRDVGRHVRKGAKAFRILAPRIVKVDAEGDDGETRPEPRCVGFLAVPVFRVEDTEGEPLDYQSIPLPRHPLMDVSRAWGVDVRAVPFNGAAYGWTDGRAIALASPDVMTWLHELMHVSDGREHALKGGQIPEQEIVAQMGAATLARLIGIESPNDGYSFSYVAGYASRWFPKASPEDAIRRACHRVLSRTCKAIERILAAANADEIPAAPSTEAAAA